MATAAVSYIAPAVASPPLYDDELVDVFQTNVVGVTGIAGTLVRPRWQPEPPNQPDFSINWVAIGCTVLEGDKFAFKGHDPTANGGLGADLFEKDEMIDLVMSFYGPNASRMAKRYEDGIQIDRNRDDLLLYGIKLNSVFQAPRNIPALFKNKWVTRVDLTVRFIRRIVRIYGVPSVVGIPNSTLHNEQYETPITIPSPPVP
jgi:hypothetical protein